MKSRIPFILLTVTLFFLTGCYTQLRYSQRINRITEEPRHSATYSWDGEEEAQPRAQTDENYEEGYEDGYYDGTEDAYYYKDYEAAEWYSRHGFGSFYDDYYFHRYSFPYWSHYRRYYDPFFYDYYPGTYASFSFSLHFGHSFGAFYGYPYRWYRYRTFGYWNPYYGYGYGPVFVNNYFYSGYAGYVGVSKRDKDKDRRYGRRSVIGTNRVRSGSSDGNVRSARASELREKGRQTSTTRVRSRDTSTRERSRSTVRSRSRTDDTRVRSTGRSRSSSSGSRSSGSTTRRSRGNDYSSSAVTNTEAQDRRDRQAYSDYERYKELNREHIRNRIENSRTSQWGLDRSVRDIIDIKRSDNSRNRVRFDFNNNRSPKNGFDSIFKSRSSNNSSSNSSTTRVRTQSSSSSRSSGNVSSSSRSRSSSRSSDSSSSSGSSSRRSRGN